MGNTEGYFPFLFCFMKNHITELIGFQIILGYFTRYIKTTSITLFIYCHRLRANFKKQISRMKAVLRNILALNFGQIISFFYIIKAVYHEVACIYLSLKNVDQSGQSFFGINSNFPRATLTITCRYRHHGYFKYAPFAYTCACFSNFFSGP